jgi:TatD DNase family protein
MSSDMSLIDTHTHLNLPHYQADQQEVIQKALDEGLSRMVIPGVTLESCLSALELTANWPGQMYCALGVHPQDALTWSEQVELELRQHVSHPAVVAIGETGLDYYWDTAPPDIQHRALRAQIQMAREFKLPLILHVRDQANSRQAYNDLIAILQAENAHEVGGVMHCFSGDQAFAEASIELGFYLAFGGVITFRNTQELQAVAASVPDQWLLIETDSPYLAPVPHRGKRNQPAYIRYVAEKLAELRGTSLSEIARITTANACRLFRFNAE